MVRLDATAEATIGPEWHFRVKPPCQHRGDRVWPRRIGSPFTEKSLTARNLPNTRNWPVPRSKTEAVAFSLEALRHRCTKTGEQNAQSLSNSNLLNRRLPRTIVRHISGHSRP